jgi:hypothetical protein
VSDTNSDLKGHQLYTRLLGSRLRPQIHRWIDKGIQYNQIFERIDLRLTERPEPPFQLLWRFPSLPGVVGASIRLSWHEDGLMTANHGAVLLAVAHLYWAVRKCGAMLQPWADMDFVIEKLGPMIGVYDTSAHPALSAARHPGLALGVELPKLGKRNTSKTEQNFARVHLPNRAAVARHMEGKLHLQSVYLKALRMNADGKGKRWSGASSQPTLSLLVRDLLDKKGTGGSSNP